MKLIIVLKKEFSFELHQLKIIHMFWNAAKLKQTTNVIHDTL